MLKNLQVCNFLIPQDDIFPGQINLLKNKKQYE